jgi:hypothetical protein
LPILHRFFLFVLSWDFPGGRAYFILPRIGRTYPGPPPEVEGLVITKQPADRVPPPLKWTPSTNEREGDIMAKTTTRRRVNRYTNEFKITAVKMTTLPGTLVQDAAKIHDIHPLMLSGWKKEYREGCPLFLGKSAE